MQLSHLKSSADAYTIVSAQKDALECLVYLMGSGYVMPPMAFLTSYLSEVDAVHVRHLLHILITTVKPPFANVFAVKLVLLMSSDNARKAIMSSHFPRSDAVGQMSVIFDSRARAFLTIGVFFSYGFVG